MILFVQNHLLVRKLTEDDTDFRDKIWGMDQIYWRSGLLETIYAYLKACAARTAFFQPPYRSVLRLSSMWLLNIRSTFHSVDIST